MDEMGLIAYLSIGLVRLMNGVESQMTGCRMTDDIELYVRVVRKEEEKTLYSSIALLDSACLVCGFLIICFFQVQHAQIANDAR